MKQYRGKNNEEIARLLNEEIDDVKSRVESVDRSTKLYARETGRRIADFRKEMNNRLDSVDQQATLHAKVVRKSVKDEAAATRTHVTTEHDATRAHIDHEVGILSRQIDALGGRNIKELVVEIIVFAALAVIAWTILDSIVLEHFARQYMDASGNLIADWDTNGKLIVSSMDANSRYISYAILAGFSGAFGMLGTYIVSKIYENRY